MSSKRAKHIVRRGGSLVSQGARVTGRHAKKGSIVATHQSMKAYKLAHRHVAKRPHEFFLANFTWYRRWHAWPKHRLVHHASLAVYVLIVGVLVFNSFKFALAADLSDSWDFSAPGNYSFDNGAEASGGVARLKAQEYGGDAATAALYHLNESSGTNIADSSANSNTATTTGSPSFSTGRMNNGLNLNGYSQNATANDAPSLSPTGQQSVESWLKPNSTFDINTTQSQSILSKGSYELGLDNTSGKAFYQVERDGGTQNWTKRLGNEQAGSWSFNHGAAWSSVSYGSDVYVGLGSSAGDAEVWKWNGTTWTMVAGDSIRSSWADQTYESVRSLMTNGTALYAGLGDTVGDGEIWTCELSTGCASWTKIGGDGLGSGGPAASTYASVDSMVVHGGSLYVGMAGSSNGTGDLFKYNGGTSWTQVAGDGLSGSWAASTFTSVSSLYSDGSNLYAGLNSGSTAGTGDLWRYNGSTWSQIGGDGVNLGGGASWNTNYERVASITSIGGVLYIGLGDSASDAEVWRLSGTTWSQIGGDGVNSSWNNAVYTRVYSLVNDGTNLYAGTGSGSAAGDVWKWNGSSWSRIGGNATNSTTGWSASLIGALTWANSKLYAVPSSTTNFGSMAYEWDGSGWTMIGGQYMNNSWGVYGVGRVQASTVFNSKIYFGLAAASSTSAAQVFEYDGTTARQIGGSGVNGSWAPWTYEGVYSMIAYKGALYVGLGSGGGDAEVWRYNGSSWTQVAGDGVGSTWNGTESMVESMAVFNGKLYVGLGYNAAYAADIWEYDGSVWAQVAGETGTNPGQIKNGSWTTNPRGVDSMTVYNNQLCAALAGNSYPEVWCWSGTGNWVKIGGGNGTSTNGSWSQSTGSYIYAMTVYRGALYAGVTTTGGHIANIWAWDGSTWTKVAGGDTNNTWSDGSYSFIKSMAVYNGYLYVGTGFTGSSNPTGDVWRYDGSSWVQVGGDSLNGGWTVSENREEVPTLTVYKGKLYAGLGFSAESDALVYSLGDNAYVESTASSFSATWHHIAGVYDGNSIKLYIDGVLQSTVSAPGVGVDTNMPLLIGSGYGSRSAGMSQPFFNGQLDEVRLSNIARSSFNSKPFSSNRQGVTLGVAVRKSGVASWDGFTANETANGGSIAYRLSADGGSTWQYWTGGNWTSSGSLADASDASTINSHIGDFPVGFGGITWQAVLYGDGTQQVILNSVSLTANSDHNVPDTNASNILAYKSNGGVAIASNAWTNGGSPYFTWTAGTDTGAGLLGYCLYLGQTAGADPTTTKGLLGASPVATGNNCQFIISGASLDLATPGLLGTALTTSSSPYYLNVRAIDKAGNVYGSSEQFQFRFDNTAPTNPAYITAPSTFVNSKEATLTWPTADANAPSDANSGLAGLQYRIGNSSSWYGDDHSGSGDSNDLLDNDGSYTTVNPPDYDNITDGINTVYFRTWDQAGNVTTSYTTAALKVNTTGAPSEPQNLVATPSTSASNSFAFNWDAPTTFNTTTGNADKLTYCYTVNTLPTVSNCNFTAQGVTSLNAGPYATQPGANTLYVVAKDDFGAINYSSFTSVTFTANTPAPGMPLNIDVADVSVKATSNWRLAVTWDQPSSVGAGINQYKIYRSTDNVTYNQIGTSSSTSFVDAGLTQVRYYYKVKACDSANNCGAETGAVSDTPTGKFTTPASMTSEPIISGVTTKRAKITWSTDRASDSKVALGTSSGHYSSSEVGNSAQGTSHEILLDNLAAGTTYYFVAKWTDEDGNTGTSQEYTFKTAPAPVLKEVNTLLVGLSNATIQFTTKDATKVDLQYGKSDSFGGIKTINTSASESTYEILLDGLDDGTKYFYKIAMYDSEGGKYESSIFSLSTPQRPRIDNLRFQPVDGEPTSTQRVTWITNVPTTTILNYGRSGTNAVTEQSNEFKTEHEITIRQLQDESEYFLIAQGRDSNGNLATSDKQIFETALDTRPPKITDIVVEPAVRGSGAEARGQIVVSWHTDEPSTSQVAYADGSNVKVFNNRTAEDGALTTEHLVIVSDLPPSRVYSIAPVSKDKAGNITIADTQPAIIGRASDSVLNIVLNTLKKVFGF